MGSVPGAVGTGSARYRTATGRERNKNSTYQQERSRTSRRKLSFYPARYRSRFWIVHHNRQIRPKQSSNDVRQRHPNLNRQRNNFQKCQNNMRRRQNNVRRRQNKTQKRENIEENRKLSLRRLVFIQAGCRRALRFVVRE